MTTIIDPAAAGLDRGHPAARHAAHPGAAMPSALGPRRRRQPTLMVSWAGPTPRPDQHGRQRPARPDRDDLRRRGVLERDAPTLRDIARWFIAHEAAHFWLGQAVALRNTRATAGSPRAAPTCSRSAPSRRSIPATTRATRCSDAVDECARADRRARRSPAPSERNEHRAYYACGAVFALVAEAALGGDRSPTSSGG